MAEPEWDTDTRDLVVGLDAVDTCGVCGRPTSVCQDPARQYDWVAGAPIRCHATTAVFEKQKAFTEETNPHLGALVWPVQLRGGDS